MDKNSFSCHKNKHALYHLCNCALFPDFSPLPTGNKRKLAIIHEIWHSRKSERSHVNNSFLSIIITGFHYGGGGRECGWLFIPSTFHRLQNERWKLHAYCTRALLTQSCVGANKLLLFCLPFHLLHCQVPFLNLNQPMMLSSKTVNDYWHFPWWLL